MTRISCIIKMVGALAILSSAVICKADYLPGPPITNVDVLRSKAITWVNIEESVTCKATATDGDCNLETSEIDYDFIDLPQTTWISNVAGTISTQGPSQTTEFSPTSAGDNIVTVTATVKDSTTQGAGDDDEEDSVSFKGYKVGVAMNITWNGDSWSDTLWQDATAPAPLTLTKTKALGYASNHLDADPTSESWSWNKFATSTWINKVSPGSATLDSAGQIASPIATTQSGELAAKAWDSEVFSGSTTLGVSLTGGAGVSASVGISHSWDGDDCSAHHGSGLAFSSDHLGDVASGQKLAISSEMGYDFTDGHYEKVATNYSSSTIFRSGRNGESKAKAILEAKNWTLGEDDGLINVFSYSSSMVKYEVTGLPEYEPGEVDADPGY